MLWVEKTEKRTESSAYLQAPVFLLWGELDPWITPASADKIQKLLPSVERHDVKGGHCPHDDVPELFIPPLQQWLQKLT